MLGTRKITEARYVSSGARYLQEAHTVAQGHEGVLMVEDQGLVSGFKGVLQRISKEMRHEACKYDEHKSEYFRTRLSAGLH